MNSTHAHFNISAREICAKLKLHGSACPPLWIFTVDWFGAWGPFLESPGKLTGPVSYFEIEVSREVECILTSNEVHFVSSAENFTV